MIRGIGVDAASISQIASLQEGPDDFYAYTFTERERLQATTGDVASKLAGCFAAKEATFKAIAHLLPKKVLDLRDIELLRAEDGSPHIEISPKARALLTDAHIDAIFVSLTNENDLAIAFVVAEGIA